MEVWPSKELWLPLGTAVAIGRQAEARIGHWGALGGSKLVRRVTGSDVGIGKTFLEVGRELFPTASSTKPDVPVAELWHSQNRGPSPDSRLSCYSAGLSRPQQSCPHRSTYHTAVPWAVFHLPLSLHWEAAPGSHSPLT